MTIPHPDPTFLAMAAAPAAAAPAASALSRQDAAFEALSSFTHGSSRALLVPLDEAVEAASRSEAIRQEVEQKLIAALKAGLSLPASEYACGKLALIGSRFSVPVLAALLADQERGEAARCALQLIPGGESLNALRTAAPQLKGKRLAGVIQALGARRDGESLPILEQWAGSSDLAVARAAVAALGDLGTERAAEVLAKLPAGEDNRFNLAIADARLRCAERILTDGNRAAALAIYRQLAGAAQAKQVQLAARRGMLAAAR